MKPQGTLDMRLVLIGGAVTLAAGVMAFALLMVVETPPGARQDFARAEARLDRIEAMVRLVRDPHPDPPNAVCQGAADTAADEMRQALEGVAARTKVTLSKLAVASGEPDGSTHGLYPVSVQFEAEGSYDAVVALAAALASSRPEMFVDTAELRSKTSAVAFKFNGRFFCSTSDLL